MVRPIPRSSEANQNRSGSNFCFFGVPLVEWFPTSNPLSSPWPCPALSLRKPPSPDFHPQSSSLSPSHHDHHVLRNVPPGPSGYVALPNTNAPASFPPRPSSLTIKSLQPSTTTRAATPSRNTTGCATSRGRRPRSVENVSLGYARPIAPIHYHFAPIVIGAPFSKHCVQWK